MLEGSDFYAVSEGEVNDAALAAHLAAAVAERGALGPSPAGSGGGGDEAARLAAFVEALEGLGAAGKEGSAGGPARPRRVGVHQAPREPGKVGVRGAGSSLGGRRGFAVLATAGGEGSESSSDDSSEDEALGSEAGVSGGVHVFGGFVAARSRARARTAARTSGTAPESEPGRADGRDTRGERAHIDMSRPARQPKTGDWGDMDDVDAGVTAQPRPELRARDWGNPEDVEGRRSPAGTVRQPGRADAWALDEPGATLDGAASAGAAPALASGTPHELRHPPRPHWAPEGSEAAHALALLAATEAKYAGLGGAAERAAAVPPAPVPVSEQRLLQVPGPCLHALFRLRVWLLVGHAIIVRPSRFSFPFFG